MSLLEYAVQAQQRGFWIFPLPPGEKFDKRLHWSQAATNDLDTIIRWWTAVPMRNIGIACKQSELLVLDCDMPKSDHQLMQDDREAHWGYLYERLGPLIDGTDCLRELAHKAGADYDELLRTHLVCTGGMGLHVYLRWPANLRASQASLVRTLLDVRSNGGRLGGYVLAPGSITEKGAYSLERDEPIRAVPGWVRALVEEKPPPARPFALISELDRWLDRAGGGGYSGLVNTVANAGEGNRNNALTWAACSMAKDGASMEEALAQLAEPATIAGLPEGEIRQTIASAFRTMKGKV